MNTNLVIGMMVITLGFGQLLLFPQKSLAEPAGTTAATEECYDQVAVAFESSQTVMRGILAMDTAYRKEWFSSKDYLESSSNAKDAVFALEGELIKSMGICPQVVGQLNSAFEVAQIALRAINAMDTAHDKQISSLYGEISQRGKAAVDLLQGYVNEALTLSKTEN